jgi:hypothetical protein
MAKRLQPRHQPRRYVVTSHESFSHDEIDSFGYDWERIGDPKIEPRRPLTVHFPETTEEVQEIVRRCRARNEKFLVRGRGHSSNDLVLAERDVSVLCTEYLRGIADPDLERETIEVQAGAVMADVDERLARFGWGLPVVGDHNHVTAGGFASVGGISPASHREGMFVDNVEALEYVDKKGNAIRCDKTDPHFYRILAGLGRHGVITRLTCRIIHVDKKREVLRNHRQITFDEERFVRISSERILDPGAAVMERGFWLDMGGMIRLGQMSSYEITEPARWKSLWNRVTHACMHLIGRFAGRLPPPLDRLERLLQYLGVVGIIFSPRYASVANVESFADKVIDSSVGDPTRMLIVLTPAEHYAVMFRRLSDLCRRYRDSWRCLTFFFIYVKGIRSRYLGKASGDENRPFSELVLYLGVVPENLRPVLDEMVAEIDQLCLEHGAFRYMHTRTSHSARTTRRAFRAGATVDPNEAHAAASSSVEAERRAS